MPNTIPSPSWMQVHLLQYILSYLEGQSFPSSSFTYVTCSIAMGIEGVVLGPPFPSSLNPTVRGCQLSQHPAKVPSTLVLLHSLLAPSAVPAP